MPRREAHRSLRLVAAVFAASAAMLLAMSVQASLADGQTAPNARTQCRDDHGVVEPGPAHAPECSTPAPTQTATAVPTTVSTASPSGGATAPPTLAPTGTATAAPTVAPSTGPTVPPTAAPSAESTGSPTISPTLAPTDAPTSASTPASTASPTPLATRRPTPRPNSTPTSGGTSGAPPAPSASATQAVTPVPGQAVEGVTAPPGNGQGGGITSGGGTPGDTGSKTGIGISNDGLFGVIAAGLLDGGPGASGQGNASLAGALATMALLLSLGGAIWAGRNGSAPRQLGLAPAGGPGPGAGSAGGGGLAGSGSGTGSAPDPMVRGSNAAHGAASAIAGVVGAGGGAAGAVSAAGALLGGFNIPWPRPDLVQGGLGIFRSMKRVTEEADPSGFSAGDLAQFVGDAAGLAAIASILAPAVGALSLATSGAAAASDVASPHEIIEGIRRNMGRLGYMQGIVDANVSGREGALGEFGRPATAPAPVAPADLSAMDDATLRAAGAEWAGLAGAALGDATADADLLSFLDSRLVQLEAQSVVLCDLLDRSETDEIVPLDDEAREALAFGRNWYSSDDSAGLAEELRRWLEGSSSGDTTGSDARPEGAPPTLDHWAALVGARNSCLGVLEATAGLERWRGFCDALAGSVGGRLAVARAQADQTAAVRLELGAELERRERPAGDA
jgi:hypothetical protein